MDNIVPYYCKIVLLTLPSNTQGDTDLYLSSGINIEHARTAYHKTCGTTLISINNHIVDM